MGLTRWEHFFAAAIQGVLSGGEAQLHNLEGIITAAKMIANEAEQIAVMRAAGMITPNEGEGI